MALPVLVNKDNEFEEIPDYEEFLKGKKSIHDSLGDLNVQVEDIEKSIWLIHAPTPSDSGFDVCAHGAKVGSQAVKEFLWNFPPLLAIHGHIHESPHYSGQWAHGGSDSLGIQAGQTDRELYYVVLEIEDGKILSVVHSVFGEYDLNK